MGRREFLWASGASLATAALTNLPTSSRAALTSDDAILRLGLIEGIAALRSGKISSFDYCMAAVEQAAKFGDHNIFTQMSPVYVQDAAAAVDGKRKSGEEVGLLQGIPYALKDSVDMDIW